MRPDRSAHLQAALFLAFALWPSAVAAADAAAPPPDIDKICKERVCREGGYEAVVFVDAQRFTTVPVTHSPYILDDGSVLVFPGETVAVQFSVDGDTLGSPVSVQAYAPHLPGLIVQSGGGPQPNPRDTTLPVIEGKLPKDEVGKLPPNSLLISYGQMQKTGGTGMSMFVESNLPQTIKVDAIIAEISSGSYKQHYTSTCPIMPKMLGNEMWPNALGPLVIRNFRYLGGPPNRFTCE